MAGSSAGCWRGRFLLLLAVLPVMGKKRLKQEKTTTFNVSGNTLALVKIHEKEKKEHKFINNSNTLSESIHCLQKKKSCKI